MCGDSDCKSSGRCACDMPNSPADDASIDVKSVSPAADDLLALEEDELLDTKAHEPSCSSDASREVTRDITIFSVHFLHGQSGGSAMVRCERRSILLFGDPSAGNG